MTTLFRTAVAVAALAIGAHASAQITLYQNDGFQGPSFTTTKQIRNFERLGFNDRASSVLVTSQRWEVCDDVRYSGRCVILRPGQYPSLRAMGLNDRVSSVRPIKRNARIDDARYAPAWTPPPQPAPAPVQVYDARPRNDERLFEVNVTSVRAIVGPPEQRCWIEREQVAQEHREPNVGGALAGALIGGVLGHQVGGGRGNDIATVGGAIAGGAIGAQAGRDDQTRTQDVQRCKTVPNRAKPSMWDVSYNFRGQEHRVQMTAPPGPTIRVNNEGDPRQ